MAPLSLSLLGPFAAWLDGRALTKFRTNKVRALLVYLAVERVRAHRRDFLMELLWPGLPQPSAQVNLRQSIYRLNQAIPKLAARAGSEPVPLLLSDRQTVQINPDGACDLDVATFTGLLKGEPTPEQLKQAMALYRSDFLADFYLPDSNAFEEWAAAWRADLRRQALDALEKVTAQALATGDLAEAEQYARRQIEIDSLREPAYCQLMEALARDGRRVDALSQYESLARYLQTELGVGPSAESQALYEAIRADEVDKVVDRQGVITLPPHPGTLAAEPPAIPYNLPQEPTPLIGRQAEVAALGDLIGRPDGRLITIVGPGGIGKTRLALACAGRYGEAKRASPDLFANGVFFINLAPVSDGDQIIPTLAQSLRFPLQPEDPRSPRQQVLDYLRQKQMLLVMDNFEHLLDGVDLLVEIALSAPAVHILVTSRERLHLQREQVFPLQGLAFPETTPAAAPQLAEDALAYPAVQLFLQSARRNQPDFELHSAADVADVTHICRLVAGMPLAIELAAAWVDTLSLADIAAEIQQSLDFLETEQRDVPERHRSVRAAINSSWERLAEREQATLAQLSVFRGGFTRAVVQAVTGASLPLLARLVNKSFLQYERENDRYQVHEVLRQFAAEKLAVAPEAEAAVRDRHSATYCAFLHEQSKHWHTAQQLEALAAVARELDNAEQSWRWALAQGTWQRLLQAIDSWGWFHNWQGRFADGESFCRAIVEKVGSQSGETAVSADCLRLWARALAWLGFFTADDSVAVVALQQSLAVLERPELAGQDTRREKAFVLFVEGESSLVLDLQEARWLIEQSLALYRELDNQWGIAAGLGVLGHLDLRTGNYDSGLGRAQAALAIHQERGDRQAQAGCMTALGIIHKTLGHLEEAERREREALRLSQRIGDRSRLVSRHANLAYTLLWQGQFAEAQQLAGESLAICQDLSHRAKEGWSQYCLSETLMHSGQYQPAYRQAAGGLLVVKAVSDRDNEAALYGVLGQLALVASSYIEAQAAFAKCAEVYGEIQHSLTDLSQAGLGYTACRLGQPQAACQHLAEALASALAVKNYGQTLFALPGVALLLAQTGAVAHAVEIWALTRRHPFVANSKWFEDVAGRELEALAATLPAEVAEAAWERGRALDLWETAADLLAELEAMSITEQDRIA